MAIRPPGATPTGESSERTKGNNQRSRTGGFSQGRVQAAIALSEQRVSCDWLTVEPTNFKGSYKQHPSFDDLPTLYNFNLVVELYSK